MNELNPQPVATRFGGVAEVKVFARQLVESSVMELKELWIWYHPEHPRGSSGI
jgi:hypothetical protein